MPSKAHDPSKPTIYLDQSTLSDAFRVHASGQTKPVDGAYLPLRGWVERVAREANLCISPIHLLELAKLSAHPQLADQLCQWLDSLPLVGVYALHRVRRAEENSWVRSAAGLSSVRVVPFASSLPAVFVELSPDIISALLARSDALTYTLAVMRENEIHRRHEDLSFNFANELRANRADPRFAGITPEQEREILKANDSLLLRTVASAAICRLKRTDEHFRVRSQPSGVTLHQALDLYDRDPSALPLFRVQAMYGDGFADGILRRTAGSSKDVAALSGASEDGAHLVGAAYCDVFTCDRATSNSLGKIRSKLGLRPQLAVGGYADGIAGFVRDLMATWP